MNPLKGDSTSGSWKKFDLAHLLVSDVQTRQLSEKILDAPSPYQGIFSGSLIPSEERLIDSSSLLALRPDLKESANAAEIALDEYAHYLTQTYYFELLGFQILGHLTANSPELSYVHAFMSQSVDEARHVQGYFQLRSSLKYSPPFAKCIPRLFERVVSEGSFHEKLLKGLIILEGLAIGLFSARSQLYGSGPVYQMDLQALHEETIHQNQSLSILEQVLVETGVTYDELVDMYREGASQLAFDILPIGVAEKHGVQLDSADLRRMKDVGLLAIQTRVSRACLRKSMSRLAYKVRKSA